MKRLVMLVMLLVGFSHVVSADQVRKPDSGEAKIQNIVVYSSSESRECLKGRGLIKFDGSWYFFEAKNPEGQSLLSIALASKATQSNVVMYVQDSGGACSPEQFKAIHNINML